MKIRIAIASRQWANGHLAIDFVGTTKNGKKYIVLHVFVRNLLVARVQLKGRQIYELANAIVDAVESTTTPSSPPFS